ncbi:general negative regulator of transcription subunit 5 [Dipsacomyces acuminosporus]|nr:general negative regulator of transcription subunit 5 [Dipsacomyces acuminosporus]
MSRKLQAEIERVFKKVAEGIEDFEECYDKVLNASNASQKEKYETDLKKEIKKLQRLRDQIKTWIQSNDIKDKQDLLHHRKLIEKQMEKFKAIEKEMKTKAYSKEGLSQSTKLDPKEKEKLDLCNWLVESVDTLSTQVDVLEATAETIQGSMGKKRRDPAKVDELNRILERVERHKYHIRRLERIQRLLENESLTTEQVQAIQEDVNYYVELNEDEDFVEDEYIYDDLPLDDDDGLFTIPGEDDSFHHDAAEKESPAQSPFKEPPSRQADSEAQSTVRPALGSKSSSAVRLASAAMPQPSTLPPAPVEPKNAWMDVKESVLTPAKPGTSTAGALVMPPPPPSSALAQPWAAVASQHAAASEAQKQTSTGISTSKLDSAEQPALADASILSGTKLQNAPVTNTSTAAAAKSGATSDEPAGSSSSSSSSSQQQQLPRDAVAPAASTSPVGTKAAQSTMPRPKYFTLFQDKDVPDAFADLMITFMKARDQFSAKKETLHGAQSQMVDLGLQGIPSLLDQERPKVHLARTQVNTPSYYPQTPLSVVEHPGMASRLDLDTLFFAFYYQPNTYQQYLAAKELKRQSWRFHKKYLTWFQRFEEPSDITDDYEQGTYIYFDYEGAWCQRKKSEFCFEYRFLEDHSL